MATISLTKSFPPLTTSVLNITESSRNASTTNFNLSFTTNLGSSQSYTYAGYVATVTISGSGVTTQSRSYTLKESGSLWSGTTTHTSSFSSSFSIPGSVSSITVAVSYKYSDETTTMSGSTSMSLTKMVSVLGTINTFNDVDSTTLSITKYSQTYTHVLNVYKRNSDNTIDTNVLYATRSDVENGYVFSFTQQELDYLYNQNTTNKFVLVSFVLTTYSGATIVGTSQAITLVIISNANPIFTDFDISDINATTTALTGDDTKFIKGYSTLEALITVANKATPQKSASMVSYSSNGVIENYSSNQDVTLSIPNYSTNTIEVSAIDSRGNSTTVSKNVDLINYEDIAITSTPSIARQSNTGETTTVNIQGTFWNSNFGSVSNSLSVSYKYRTSGSTGNYTTGTTTITPTISNNTFAISNQAILGDTNAGFDAENSYEVVFTITDELSSYEIALTLQAGIPAFAVYGNKMSIGDKYDEYLGGTQLCNDIYVNGHQFRYIEEAGTSGGWTYRKWSDGTAECWCKKDITGAGSQVWVSPLYYFASYFDTINFPFTFLEVPIEQVNVIVSPNACWLYKESEGQTTTTHTARYRPIKVNAFNTTSQTITAAYYVIGRWK